MLLVLVDKERDARGEDAIGQQGGDKAYVGNTGEQQYAEGKRWHHLGIARYRGRWKVHLQGLLTYLVMNLKRIITIILPLQTA